MKRILTLLIIGLISINGFAQSPEMMSYQAVVRDAISVLVTNTSVGMKVSILQGSASGSAVFIETHTPSTNDNGLISIEIGNGTLVNGSFSSIDWGVGAYFVKTEIDPTGGTNYSIIGISQLLSVPYALHAKTAENVDDADSDVTNEIQELSLSGSELSLSNGGGSVTLTTGVGTDDQTLILNGTSLSITDGNSVDLSSIQDGVDDADNDASNEIQTLSQNGNVVSLSNGGGSVTVTDNQFSGDYNDLTNQPNIPTVPTNVSAFTNDAGYVTTSNDADADPINELQNLSVSLAGDTLHLQSGGYVIIPGISAANDPYPSGSVFCASGATSIVDVTNPTTGAIWMDRNLGATQAATSSTDVDSYGDLYQWGRRSDGHQCRNSATTSTLSSIDQPAHGDFITINSGNYDWRSPENDNLWQGVNGINNPCPSGYRLPTEAELNAERLSWSSDDAAGAIASPLKLSMSGGRFSSDGSLYAVGVSGYLWSSTVIGNYSRILPFASSNAGIGNDYQAGANSVRCLKD
jgi:hypothetical protein